MKLLAALVMALVLPASAFGALEVKLSVLPKPVKKGAPSLVELRPYWTYNRPDGSCCLLRKANVRYPFKIEAVSPSGRVYRVVMRRTKSPYVWSGTFRFNAAGRWVVRAPQWGPAYSSHFGARPRIAFTVAR